MSNTNVVHDVLDALFAVYGVAPTSFDLPNLVVWSVDGTRRTVKFEEAVEAVTNVMQLARTVPEVTPTTEPVVAASKKSSTVKLTKKHLRRGKAISQDTLDRIADAMTDSVSFTAKTLADNAGVAPSTIRVIKLDKLVKAGVLGRETVKTGNRGRPTNEYWVV